MMMMSFDQLVDAVLDALADQLTAAGCSDPQKRDAYWAKVRDQRGMADRDAIEALCRDYPECPPPVLARHHREKTPRACVSHMVGRRPLTAH